MGVTGHTVAVPAAALLLAAGAWACDDGGTAPQWEPDGGTDADTDTGSDTGPLPDLPPGIFELDGIDPTLPADDLAPLDDLVGDAEVVALGESVHTSGGYYAAKHRLIRYLVEHRGFRAVAFESPWQDADLVAAFVATGDGSGLVAVVDGLFGVWASQEVLDLVNWLRERNEAHPEDPVAFFGFDVQQPWDDSAALKEFAELVDPGGAAALNAELARCNGAAYASDEEYYADPGAQVVDEEDHAACVAALDALEAFLDENEAGITAQIGADALAWGRVRLVGLRAWEGEMYYFESDPALSYEARDEGMAYAFLEIRRLRHPGARTALWAHNWHIARAAEEMNAYPLGARNMGSFLAEALGAEYVAVGQCALHVFIDWPGVGFGEVDFPLTEDAVEHRLHALGRDHLLVDLDFPGADEPFLPLGETMELGWYEMVPADQFDGLVFHEVSPAMDPLLW